MDLTSKQRAQLRGLANSIDTILIVGKDGIGDNLVKQANDALEARELIKGKVLENSLMSAREAAEAAARMEHSYLKQWDKVTVLFEEERDGLWWGHTRQYCRVGVRSEENLHNQLRKVQVTAVKENSLLGELLNLENE